MDTNTKNKIKAILFIIIFLLLAAVIIYFITGNNEREYYSSYTPVRTAEVLETSDLPTPLPSSAVKTPAVTPTPAPTPTPEPAPTPTPEPTPEPFVAGQVLATGSFASNTGALINIRADYNAVSETADTVAVNVTVYLDYYTIHIIEADTLHIALNGQYVTVRVPAIDTDVNGAKTTALGSTTFSVSCPLGQSLSMPLNVEWQFNGSYGGVDLPVVECGGTVDIQR